MVILEAWVSNVVRKVLHCHPHNNLCWNHLCGIRRWDAGDVVNDVLFCAAIPAKVCVAEGDCGGESAQQL